MMRLISIFLGMLALLPSLQAEDWPSSTSARRLLGVPICGTRPTTTGDVLAYSSVTGMYCPAAQSGTSLSGGTANQFTYWTAATTVGSTGLFTLAAAAPASTFLAPTSPVLYSRSGSGDGGLIYCRSSGSFGTDECLVDFKLATSNLVYRFGLVDPGSNHAFFSSTGSGWSLNGLSGFDATAITATTFGVTDGGQIRPDGTTCTSTAAACTISKQHGIITTEALTTAGLAAYTLTLTNTLIATTSAVYVTVWNGTNSAGTPTVGVATPGSGSATIVINNAHASAAFNGTIKMAFNVVNQQ